MPNSTTDAHINNGGTAQIGSGGDTALNVVLGLTAGHSGSLSLPFLGDSLLASGDITVGDSGTGTMGISMAGLASSVNGVIGNAAGSTGTVTVDGGFIIFSSRWNMSSSLTVGNAGTGTLNITNGGIVSVGSVSSIANSDGSTGTVTVDGMGSTWTNTNNLFVGGNGNGTLHITSGGSVSNLNGIIGTGTSVGANGAVTVDGMGSTWTNNGYLVVGNVGPGTLSITNGGLVSNTDGTIGDSPNSNGTVTVDGMNSKWTNTGMLIVGNSGTGTLNIQNGGLVSNTAGYIGGNPFLSGTVAPVGTVNVDGAGSTWTNNGDLYVAFFAGSTGTLNITNGGSVSNHLGAIASATGSTGMATVDGIGSTWTSINNLLVGDSGTGTLMVTNGGLVSSEFGFIGGIGGTGTATVNGSMNGTASKWTITSGMFVGENGNGTLNVTGGGMVSDVNGTIGDQPGAVGTANIDGAGSTWTNSGTLTVGSQSNGSLNITNGGTVMVNGSFARIGEQPTSTSSVTVDGLGSTWTLANELDVARAGTGALMIQNRGTVNMTGASRASIGVVADSNGTMTVDGTGSTFTNGGGLLVGDSGNGALHITSGGAVSNSFGQIGSAMGSTGTATVDGAGSTWTNNGTFLVGNAGTGMMTVTDGGAVTSGNSQIGSSSTGVGTAIIDGNGSSWTTSSLYVGGDTGGPQGTGLLRILNGGTVSSGSTTVWSSGTLEIGVNPVLNGTLIFVGGTLRTIADTTFPNQIILGGSGIIIDSNGFDSTLSGPINGVVGGMTKINPGTIILTNMDTVPDGTNIYGGVLQVDGSLTSNVVVKADGTLAGIGTVVGNVDNNGIVSPGDSPGTLTITGNYMQNATGTLRIEIGGLNSGVNSDLLSVGNVATLAIGSTLQLVPFNNFHPLPGDQVTILTATNGVQGEFSTVTDNFDTVVHPTLVYNANDVMVLFIQGSFNLGGLTFNQSAVASELDEVVADPRAMDLIAFLDMESQGNLPHDYDLIAPEELASIYEIGFSQAVVSNMNLQHRMDDIRAGSTGFCANGYQARETSGYSKESDGTVALDKNPTPAFAPSPENRWGFFVTGSGDFVNVGDHDINAHGYDITTGNVTVGADYRVCDHFAVGIDGSYSGSTADLVDRGRVEVDGGKAGAYATVFGYKILGSMIHIDGAVSGGWNSYDTHRTGVGRFTGARLD